MRAMWPWPIYVAFVGGGFAAMAATGEWLFLRNAKSKLAKYEWHLKVEVGVEHSGARGRVGNYSRLVHVVAPAG